MRRLALLLVGGAIWLFLAAIPALADGGPHVKDINNGTQGINADSCAGCHRAHTAAGPFLINAANDEALCFTCHGAGGTGSTVDVATGIQYTLGAAPNIRTTTVLGALRNGGFIKAAIDSSNAMRESYPRNADGDISQRPRVGVLAAPEAVTSSHLTILDDPSTLAADGNGITMPGIAWGNGAFGDASVGPSVGVALECVSCHNPHGNGQYRILRPIPILEGADFDAVDPGPVSTITETRANSGSRANRIMTGTLPNGPGHGLWTGDTVTITGTTFNGTYVVESVGVDSSSASAGYTGSGLPFLRVFASGSSGPLLAPGTATGLTGSVVRSTSATVPTLGIHVTDAALPGTGDTRNYTVIQNPLVANDSQGGPVLTQNAVIGAGYGPTDGDYFRRNVPWSPAAVDSDCDPTVFTQPATCTVQTNNDAPNGLASFNEQITAWCSTCHSRYLADGTIPVLGSGYETDSGDPTFTYRHSTRSNRTCNVCHVAHGSNATMDGDNSSNYLYPDMTTLSDSSRLLKVDNRGTCQSCHDPTETTVAGQRVDVPVPLPYP